MMKNLWRLVLAIIICAGLAAQARAQTPDNQTAPKWGNPTVKTLRRVSVIDAAQHEPNFLSNIDCDLMDYRQTNSSTMQTGCFTPTAFGLIDSDSDMVIYNGTDEALPLIPYSPHQVLSPWPQALDLIALDAVNTGGSYISLYKNPLSSLQDQRNLLLQLTGKRLKVPPELRLTDPSGKQLVINSQSMAFSDGGGWLVVEALSGSFVRINLATLDMTAFAPAFGSTGSPALLKSRVAISGDGNFVAIANEADSSFKVYDLTTCSEPANGLQPLNCRVSNYRSFVSQQIAGLQSIRHVRFVNDGLLSFEAYSSNPTNNGIYELAPTDSIDSLIDYLALGDSYTSGEGAFNYLAGTDTQDNVCHLSAKSYPLLLTKDLFSKVGGHSVACSGAVINDAGSTSKSYRGQVRGVANFEQLQSSQASLLNSIMTNYMPGYIAQQRFVSQYQPRIVTVSVGGDDIGFGDIIQNCVMPHVSTHFSDSTCYNTYEDRLELIKLIDRTVARWTALYKQLVKQSPSTRYYAIGYPRVVYDKGNCALNAHLGKVELEFAEEIVDYLNTSVKQAASKAGINYIDISQALAGHRLCETASYNVAVNGLSAGKDGGFLGLKVFGKESYHPNALGQALIEQAILRQSHNLTDSLATAPANNNSQTLLAAPKTGRKVSIKTPATGVTSKIVKKKSAASIKLNGAASGLKANTAYKVNLDGSDGVTVGTVTTDNNGDIDSSIVLGDNTAAGGHTIDIVGDNQTDELIDVTQPIYIPATEDDSDGDSITDASDSCPAAINSGSDADHDNTDDSCDGFIGLPPSSSSGTTPIDPPLSTSSTLATGSINHPTVVASIRTTSSTLSALGSTTINPHLLKRDTALKQPSHAKTNKTRLILRPLPVINLLLWSAIALITWLFAAGIRRLEYI